MQPIYERWINCAHFEKNYFYVCHHHHHFWNHFETLITSFWVDSRCIYFEISQKQISIYCPWWGSSLPWNEVWWCGWGAITAHHTVKDRLREFKPKTRYFKICPYSILLVIVMYDHLKWGQDLKTSLSKLANDGSVGL